MKRFASVTRCPSWTTFRTASRHVTVTIRDALNKAIDEEMARDASVFLIGEEVAQYNGAYKVTKGLCDKYGPHRVIDTPITEYGFTGIAVGAALQGLRPVVEFMSFNFSLQAIDHIVNSAAKGLYMSNGELKCPIVFRGCNGASAGVGAQHSQCLAPWYASVPGLKVLAVATAEDARGMIKTAIRDPGPVVLLEHELTYGTSFEVGDADYENFDFTCPYKAKIERPGTDLTIVTFARGVQIALDAAKILSDRGLADAEVINLRSLRPIDTETIIKSVHKTHRVITLDESWPICNIGAEICGLIMESSAFDMLDAPVERISCADVPTPYALNLERASQPQIEDVVAAATRVCARNRF